MVYGGKVVWYLAVQQKGLLLWSKSEWSMTGQWIGKWSALLLESSKVILGMGRICGNMQCALLSECSRYDDSQTDCCSAQASKKEAACPKPRKGTYKERALCLCMYVRTVCVCRWVWVSVFFFLPPCLFSSSVSDLTL